MSEHALRRLPSVDRVLRELDPIDLPRPVQLAMVRHALAAARHVDNPPSADALLAALRQQAADLLRTRLTTVINATGIIVHTNLGRAPLAPAAVDALSAVAANYNTLEYDLATGQRGSRAAYLEHLLATLCEAPAATVVNNNAAALVLILRHFARPDRPHVVISRGELVQIGGGFRIPEILEASGATLREIGTTNQTTLDDYAAALDSSVALVLKVHRSNFYMGGFVASPPTDQLAVLARRHHVPFVEDLGSGATDRTATIPAAPPDAEREPTPAQILRQGADLVCFSGDKLLGGPQAGIIAGAARHVLALKKEPFFRALRCDKLVLAALEATVDLHLRGQEVPVAQMLALPPEALATRAQAIVAALSGLPAAASVGQADAQIGGGALPRTTIASVTVDLAPHHLALADLAARLRLGTPPVIAYLGSNRVRLDLRTVFPHQDAALVAAIRAALSAPGAA